MQTTSASRDTSHMPWGRGTLEISKIIVISTKKNSSELRMNFFIKQGEVKGCNPFKVTLFQDSQC